MSVRGPWPILRLQTAQSINPSGRLTPNSVPLILLASQYIVIVCKLELKSQRHKDLANNEPYQLSSFSGACPCIVGPPVPAVSAVSKIPAAEILPELPEWATANIQLPQLQPAALHY